MSTTNPLIAIRARVYAAQRNCDNAPTGAIKDLSDAVRILMHLVNEMIIRYEGLGDE